MTVHRLPFESVFSDESGGNVKTPQGEYLPQGAFPIVDQGRSLIGGYTDERERLCGQGRPAIVFGDHTRCIKYIDFPFCMGADGVKVLRPRIDADLKYLYYFLGSLDLPSAGYDRHFKYLKRVEVVVPPRPEQRRIAAILDQADALKAKRREALAQLDSLTQSIFIEMFGDPATNSRDLPLSPLAEFGTWRSGGTPPRDQGHYFEGDIPWFSSGELESMYVNRSAEHISEEAIRKTSVKLVPSGSLMLGMYDTAALKASIAAIDCACNQAIAFALVDSDRAEVSYVYYAIVIGREHFRRLQRGVRQKNLNLSMIREIQIPWPPLAQQQTFATRIQAVEALKATHHAALTDLDALFAALQHRAFAGQLS